VAHLNVFCRKCVGNPVWVCTLKGAVILPLISLIDEEGITGEALRASVHLFCDDRYKGVKIENFSTSWRNGLGFNALIHAHRPDLINYDALNPADHIGNLNNAFNVAEDKLGIARLLDAEGLFYFIL